MKNRPKINFDMLNIYNGAELVYDDNPRIRCTVCGPNKVKYNGEIMSLTRVYGNLIGKKTTESINGYAHFKYNNEILTDMRKRIENS